MADLITIESDFTDLSEAIKLIDVVTSNLVYNLGERDGKIVGGRAEPKDVSAVCAALRHIRLELAAFDGAFDAFLLDSRPKRKEAANG